MANNIEDLEKRIVVADDKVDSLCAQLREMSEDLHHKLEEIALCGRFGIIAQDEQTALSEYNPQLTYPAVKLPIKTVGYVGNPSRDAINFETARYKAAVTVFLISHARVLCAHERAYVALLQKATVEPLLPEKRIPKALLQIEEPNILPLTKLFMANVYQGTYSPVPPTWEAQFRKLVEMGDANLYHVRSPSGLLSTSSVLNYVMANLCDKYIDACIAAGMNGAQMEAASKMSVSIDLPKPS